MLFAASALALLAARTVAAAEHTVVVGGPGKLAFDPEAIFAAPGDVVHFVFKQKNHTATQSSFAAPCSPLLGPDSNPLFDTGFHPVPDTQTDGFDIVDYHVQDTKPVWVHCRQAGHCSKGMVFAINCGPDGAQNSFTNFKASAIATGATASAAPPPGSTTIVGGVTVGPDPAQPTVTAPITVGTSVWTTTYASYPNSPNATPVSLSGDTIVIKVGSNGLNFDPPTAKVKPRDTLKFVFYNKNHTVTQSSFANPCRKLEFTSTSGEIGFDSGFKPVTDGTPEASLPSYEVKINNTAPIYAYCRQANHCGSGMVFAANLDETSDRNYAAFVTLAKNLNGTGPAGAQSPNPYGGASQLAISGILGAVGTLFALFM